MNKLPYYMIGFVLLIASIIMIAVSKIYISAIVSCFYVGKAIGLLLLEVLSYEMLNIILLLIYSYFIFVAVCLATILLDTSYKVLKFIILKNGGKNG